MSPDLVLGRKTIEMLPQIIAGCSHLHGARDIIAQVNAHAFASIALAVEGLEEAVLGIAPGKLGKLVLNVGGGIEVELRVRDEVPPFRMVLFRREDAPS